MRCSWCGKWSEEIVMMREGEVYKRGESTKDKLPLCTELGGVECEH